MRVYISGPMKGKTNLNKEAFDEAAKLWEEAGCEVINPHDYPLERRDGETDEELYERYMRQDFLLLGRCDTIHLLAGWSQSKGAISELKRARRLGITVLATPYPII